MSLKSPNLDDRRFDDLVEESLKRIRQTCPQWSDLSPSDPGVILLESFAYLTEAMIYRLNRIPEKAYIEFLKLLGVTLYPPSSAGVVLNFSTNTQKDYDIEIPAKTRVTTSRSSNEGSSPIFYTNEKAVIKKGEMMADVLASHCQPVSGELAGKGTGNAGLIIKIKHPPVAVASIGNLDFIVGVETDSSEIKERTPAIQYKNKVYRIWTEIDSFTGLSDRSHVYTVDRVTGTIKFAPEIKKADSSDPKGFISKVMGSVVEEDLEIRIWYSSGGGPNGNIGANTLTVIKDSMPGIKVTNPFAAAGGRKKETTENAILRGPGELHSLERAVTAEDFEHIARKISGGVVRAKAFTKAALWAHAMPGTVEVLMVPNISDAEMVSGRVSLNMLTEKESDEILAQIRNILEDRKPLGTTCLANWVRYKPVNVLARVVVHRGQELKTVKQQVEDRLYRTINPIPVSKNTGWPFGKPLRISDIYDIILKEPGVSYADNVCFTVDDVPGTVVNSVSEDFFQKNTWYAADGNTIYRTMNNGEGWEAVFRLDDDEIIESVCASNRIAGYIAVHTKKEGAVKSSVYVSGDSGESWQSVADTAFEIEDVAWSERDGTPLLYMATDVGLYELWIKPGAVPLQILVDSKDQDNGFYSVVTSFDNRGTQYVIAASQKEKGVFMSSSAGQSGSFTNIGFENRDVRVLAVQIDGPRTFLWAGITVIGSAEGDGCYSTELAGSDISRNGWINFNENWGGGSCRAIAFMGSVVFAATHRSGVLSLNISGRNKIWSKPGIRCGLPSRDTKRLFHPISSLAVNPGQTVLLAGTPEGVFKSTDGEHFIKCSKNLFSEKVTLPETWLFCSGTHEIKVETDDEAERY